MESLCAHVTYANEVTYNGSVDHLRRGEGHQKDQVIRRLEFLIPSTDLYEGELRGCGLNPIKTLEQQDLKSLG